MIRVVADTNIFISAVMFGGLPGTFLDLAFMKPFQLVTSRVLLDELDEKLRGKFEVSPDDADIIRLRLGAVALIVEPDSSLKVMEDDPDDDRFWNAVAAQADLS